MLEELNMCHNAMFTILPGSGQKRHDGDTSSTSGSVDGSDEEEEEDYEVDVTHEMSNESIMKHNESFNMGIKGNNTGTSSEGTSESDEEEAETSNENPHFNESFSSNEASDDLPNAVNDVVNAIHRDICVSNNQSNEERQSKSDSKENVQNEKMFLSFTPFGQGETLFSFKNTKSKINKEIVGNLVEIQKKNENVSMESDENDENMSKASSSNISDKNMADFDGEELSDLIELAFDDNNASKDDVKFLNDIDSASAAQKLATIAKQIESQHNVPESQKLIQNDNQIDQLNLKVEEIELADMYIIDNLCKPGRTLLWDLLQDDMITQLSDGLAQEVEKIFWNTVCWSNDRRIRMKFIEGCLDNLAKNYSVIASLRLLPKFFFQFRNSGLDAHHILLWADKEKHMLKHFFSNLIQYCENRKKNSSSEKFDSQNEIYTHTEQIQARLHFLSFVFSCAGSPSNFRLSQEQVDILWSALALDPESSDELFNWLLTQVRSRDQHGLGGDMLHHILIHKIPLLAPESFSMMALDLLQTLTQCLITSQQANRIKDVDQVAIKQLWNIALRANNVDVSMNAIKHLNSYYIHLQPHSSKLDKEEEFIKQCMDHLERASKDLAQNEDQSFTIIQRALVLLKTHLEVFRCRFAYYFRRWQLEGDISFLSHRNRERTGNLVRISCQLAALTDKVSENFIILINLY